MYTHKLYLIGSLRNERIPVLAKSIRKKLPHVEVFDDWYSAGYEADDYWKAYEKERGHTYSEALAGYAATHVFEFDKHHLDISSHVLLVLPAGKSGHMELMYAKYGAGKEAAILLDPKDDVRFDVMYKFIDNILESDKEIEGWLNQTLTESVRVNPEVSSMQEKPPLFEGYYSTSQEQYNLLQECPSTALLSTRGTDGSPSRTGNRGTRMR